jgi:metal-sulfur cluster biosynthetic enzyme
VDAARAPAAESAYPYSGPQGLQAPIDAALRQVVDPEIALNIVDVGLVYAVTVTDKRVHVLMTMTSAACPVTDVIVEDVEVELDKVLPSNFRTHVEIAWQPPWDTERMSPRAKDFMGW